MASNRRSARLIVPCAVLAAMAACTGCLSGGKRNDQGTALASAVRDPVLQDIPRPQGFVIDDQKSMAFASGRVRMARCQYAGSVDPLGVKRFYEEYMPSAHFRLLQWSLEKGVYDLRFESDSELCGIRIWRERSRTGLMIEVGPRPRGTAERSDNAPPPLPRRG